MTPPASHRRSLLAIAAAASLALLAWVVLGDSTTRTSAATLSQPEETNGTPATETPGDLQAAEASSLESAMGNVVAEELDAEAPEIQRTSLETPATLSVRVKNGRKPLAGVRVQAVKAGTTNQGAIAGETDRRGRLKLQVPPHTALQLQLALPGIAEIIRQDVQSPGPAEIEPVVVDVSLHASELSVTVQLLSFPSGMALADCKVTAMPSEDSSSTRSLARRTDANGLVTLPWVPNGRYVGEAERHGQMELAAPEAGTDRPLTLELPADAMLFGRVELEPSASGKIPELKISASRDGKTRNSSSRKDTPEEMTPLLLHEVPVKWSRDWQTTMLGQGRTKVDKKGNWQIVRIRFKDLNAMEGVQVHAFVDHNWRTLSAGIALRPGDRLEVADAGQGQPNLHLNLSFDRGYKWSRFQEVTLYEASQPGQSSFVKGYCTKDGTLRVSKLPRGTWDLCLGSPSDPREESRLVRFEHRDAAPQDIVLLGWVPLRGTVTPPRPKEHKGADLMLLQRDGRLDTCVVKDGRFDLSPVRMDTMQTLSMRGSDHGLIRFDVPDADADASFDVDVEGFWSTPAVDQTEHKVQYLATGEDMIVRR